MFFSKKDGFHNIFLYVEKEESHPLNIVVPEALASDVVSTIKKLERSGLNQRKYIGEFGTFKFIMDVQGFRKIEIHNDAYSWSEPLLYTDFAKKIADRLQNHIDSVSENTDEDVEEDLVYFIGEFTMMQDNGFVAPF